MAVVRFVCANIIAFYGLFEMICHGKTSDKEWENIRETISSNFRTAAGKNNIEELRLVMKIDICVRVIILST